MASPDGYMASVEMWAPNFAPRQWAFCHGQLLPIASYNALFSLLGTNFGGDGRTSFGVPNFKDRFPLGNGGQHFLGQLGGTDQIYIGLSNMPQHTHIATGSVKPAAMTGKGTYTNDPTNNYAGQPADGTNIYGPTARVEMAESDVTVAVQPAGGSVPITHLPPFQCINFIIALEGVYPPRN